MVALLYAFQRDSHIRTNRGTRSRLRADAEQDLIFLEGLEAARPQGIVLGDIRRRVISDEKAVSQLPTESLAVIAVSGNQRVSAATGRSGEFMIVLPPGTVDVWVERAGQPVSPRQRVRLDANVDPRLDLPVSY